MNLYTAAGAGTHTTKQWTQAVVVVLWGGGGGGGAGTSAGNGWGGGGGSGAYAEKSDAVSGNTGYAYTVGAAGGSAASGGDSLWRTTVGVADGGYGGTTNAADGTGGGLGGTLANSTGDYELVGNTGDVVFVGLSSGGGATSIAGRYGVSELGGGPRSNADNLAGITATNPSAGGGGAHRISGGTKNGGSGAPGKIIVFEQYQVDLLCLGCG